MHLVMVLTRTAVYQPESHVCPKYAPRCCGSAAGGHAGSDERSRGTETNGGRRRSSLVVAGPHRNTVWRRFPHRALAPPTPVCWTRSVDGVYTRGAAAASACGQGECTGVAGQPGGPARAPDRWPLPARRSSRQRRNGHGVGRLRRGAAAPGGGQGAEGPPGVPDARGGRGPGTHHARGAGPRRPVAPEHHHRVRRRRGRRGTRSSSWSSCRRATSPR